MSHADRYLRTVLTVEQWAELKKHRNHDNRDSTARQKYRFYRRTGARIEPWIIKSRGTALAYLVRHGYCDPAGNWIADIKP